MKYMGSKRRIAKEIIPIMLKDYKEGQTFYDLFAGGFNLIDKIPKHIPKVANDLNEYIIELVKQLQIGWLPEREITEDKFNEIKLNKNIYPKYYLGYIGYQLTYGSQWFGSFRRDSIGKRNYSIEAFNNISKQAPLLKDIKLFNLSYDEVQLKPNSIIYLDPPYRNTSGYITGDFDYNKFYDWCIEKHKEGHKVFISEYYMPEDKFKCIWQKEIVSSLTPENNGKKGIEKLFVVR